MTILWLSDFTTIEVPAGGAEITDSYVIQAGRFLGYDIMVLRPRDCTLASLDAADLIILSNNFEFSDSIKSEIIKRKKYIAYSHDIGRWGAVVKRNSLLFKNAEASIFLSPGHRDNLKFALTGAKNILCIPPHIPLTFYDRGYIRNSNVMYAGTLYDGKGLTNIMQVMKQNPQLNFDLYYKCFQDRIVSQLTGYKNCKLCGYVPKEQLVDVYNKYEYFVHLPIMYECFGRAVTEALLSGCKLLVNQNIGLLSYNWDIKTTRENTMNAHFFFWAELKRLNLV